MEKKTIIVSTLFFVLLCFILVKPWKDSSAMAKSDIPIMNDAWYDALKAIEKDSSGNPGQSWEKGIITSWWDFGHHFKYLSNRAVTFDGGTQVTPQAHWVGKLFLSSDEDVSVNILRMLDCDGNGAFDELVKKYDAPTSVRLLNDYFTGKIDAGNVLSEGMRNKLNCNPTSGYVIASEDMIGKAGVWGHFGSWDFNRADMWVNVKKMTRDNGTKYILEKGYASDQSQADQLWSTLQTMTESDANNWIAPWPGYAGVNDCQKIDCVEAQIPRYEENINPAVGDVNITGGLLKNCYQCNNGVNILDEDVILPEGKKPQSFIYTKGGKIVEKRYQNATLGYSFTLTPDNKLITASPELANSLFTKLFYMNATGLKNFKLLTMKQGLDGFKIYVYKVEW